MSGEQKRNRAVRNYREKGDSSLAEEIGLFWNKADEEQAREAQRLRFSDNPFSTTELSNEVAVARYEPILQKQTKESIKQMLSLFKPIVEPYTVYRATQGPVLTSEGKRAEVGDELCIDGFMHASRHPGFAAECAVHEFGKGFVVIEIQPTPEAETITLANEVKGRREYESIFNLGQSVRIDEINTNLKADFHPLNKVATYYKGTLRPG